MGVQFTLLSKKCIKIWDSIRKQFTTVETNESKQVTWNTDECAVLRRMNLLHGRDRLTYWVNRAKTLRRGWLIISTCATRCRISWAISEVSSSSKRASSFSLKKRLATWENKNVSCNYCRLDAEEWRWRGHKRRPTKWEPIFYEKFGHRLTFRVELAMRRTKWSRWLKFTG